MPALDIVMGFARTLRHAGVPATPDRVQAMVVALGHLDVASPADTYWAGRLTLCGDPADLDRYDAAFAAYFGGAGAPAPRPRPAAVRLRAVPLDDRDGGGADPGDGSTRTTLASRQEVLRHRDVSTLSAAERDEVRRLLALLAPQVGQRRTRRYGPASRGAVDLGRTVRRMLHQGGEPSRLARKARRHKPRRLVLLADVSGSMEPYADALLRFAHAAVRVAPFNVEVFTLGTRLTRVTRELRQRDPDAALQAA
ncbi:MAG TPA: VWA domain-containing protein, partial [Jatrophihabitantaceae bacterium]|nr:VWA domain-containing protein [Jatrophihabitantaceae bacterium]